MKIIYKKLKQARYIIKQLNLKKSGRNEFSKFDYYTPEQVEKLVDIACEKTNTLVLCNLKKDEYGLYQTLDFIDLESEEKISFEMRTKHGSITATNETQQMGGTDTYSERYIKMKVFQIKDNNLDFDAQKNTKSVKEPKKEPKSQKAQILFLLKELGIKAKTKEEYQKVIKTKTQLNLIEKNYNEIIEKLEIINNEKKQYDNSNI